MSHSTYTAAILTMLRADHPNEMDRAERDFPSTVRDIVDGCATIAEMTDTNQARRFGLSGELVNERFGRPGQNLLSYLASFAYDCIRRVMYEAAVSAEAQSIAVMMAWLKATVLQMGEE